MKDLRPDVSVGASAGTSAGAASAEEFTAGEIAITASRWRRMLDSDAFYSFCRSPLVMLSALVTAVLTVMALGAPLFAPHNPFDPASLDLLDSLLPPAWSTEGQLRYPLGTDDQGRDIFSSILYGSRISLGVGFASVFLGLVLGLAVGLLAGYRGGWLDSFLMRVADIQLSFPTILIALQLAGVARALLPPQEGGQNEITVAVVSIALTFWVQHARTVRGSVLVEREKEYVQAAQVVGLPPWYVLFRHILPNVLGPVLVIATIQLALAIILEATLSFLGVGVPVTSPSLGTLIRIGNDYLFSGEWWITIFPGLTLIILALAINLLGDWLRDTLNPKIEG